MKLIYAPQLLGQSLLIDASGEYWIQRVGLNETVTVGMVHGREHCHSVARGACDPVAMMCPRAEAVPRPDRVPASRVCAFPAGP